MKFEKIHEAIERVDNHGGFLLMRTLRPCEEILLVSDEQLINDIIHSKYHHWQGEKEPKGITVSTSSRDKYGESSRTLVDHTFYGFYDNSKIKADHYKCITFDEFYMQIIGAIELETENDSRFIELSKKAIHENLKNTSTFYVLDLDPELNKDLLAEWQVYDFFYGFISVDREINCICIIEFGLD